jgi:hypothetical protein
MAKRLSLIAPIALSLVIVVNYQNCAPSKMGAADGAPNTGVNATANSSVVLADPNAPQQVTIIDDIRADTKVSFVQTSALVAPLPSTTSLNGICSQKETGATLRWTLTDDISQEAIGDGFAGCDRGGFQIDAPANLMTCGKSYHILAQFGVDPGAEMQLQMPCAN